MCVCCSCVGVSGTCALLSSLRGKFAACSQARTLGRSKHKTGLREEPPWPQDGEEPEPGGRGRRPPGVRRLICYLSPSCPSNRLTAGAARGAGEGPGLHSCRGWPGGRGGLRRGNASRCNMEAGVLSNKMTSSSRDQSQGEADTLVGGFMCEDHIRGCDLQ